MKQQLTAPDFIEHISNQPWSNYTKADYTLEQWHAACLIHLHDGPPTSKDECKLPVRTPDGALNRNGVHAAAAVLAGARGGVNATSDKTAAARKKIKSLYAQLGEKPPASMMMSSTTEDAVESVLEHHGVRGMRWGVRRRRSSSVSTAKTGGVRPVQKTYVSRDAQAVQALRSRKPSQLTNKQLKQINERMNMEQNFKRMNPRKIDKGHERVKYILAFGTTAATAAGLTAKFLKTPAGQRVLNKGRGAIAKHATSIAAKSAAKAFPSPLTFA